MFKKLASAGILLAMAASATAQAQPKLFKDYVYNAPKSAFTRAKGFEDCTESVGRPALCREGVSFLGEAFGEALIFTNGRLRMVTLYATETDGMVEKVYGAMNDTFMMGLFSDGKQQMDLVKEARAAKSGEELGSKLMAFQTKAVLNGSYSATFVEKFQLPKKKPDSFVQLMKAAPEDLRVAQVDVLDEDDETTVMVSFGFPKLDSKAISAELEANKEAF